MSGKTVLVTGIGGVVGQGILRNIVNLHSNLRIIGVNIAYVSAGNYLCDKVHQVPYAYDEGYISKMIEICQDEKPDLVIPSTDYEAYYLAKSRDLFSCSIAVSSAETTKIALDKYATWEALKRYGIPFAASTLPSMYSAQFDQYIVKPREGRGSRNIYFNPGNPQTFDDTYVVQEYLDGPELTTAFYIKKNGDLHGMITFIRELEQGNTSKAEVTFEYDKIL